MIKNFTSIASILVQYMQKEIREQTGRFENPNEGIRTDTNRKRCITK